MPSNGNKMRISINVPISESRASWNANGKTDMEMYAILTKLSDPSDSKDDDILTSSGYKNKIRQILMDYNQNASLSIEMFPIQEAIIPAKKVLKRK
jgi:hypothetical protein